MQQRPPVQNLEMAYVNQPEDSLVRPDYDTSITAESNEVKAVLASAESGSTIIPYEYVQNALDYNDYSKGKPQILFWYEDLEEGEMRHMTYSQFLDYARKGELDSMHERFVRVEVRNYIGDGGGLHPDNIADIRSGQPSGRPGSMGQHGRGSKIAGAAAIFGGYCESIDFQSEVKESDPYVQAAIEKGAKREEVTDSLGAWSGIAMVGKRQGGVSLNDIYKLRHWADEDGQARDQTIVGINQPNHALLRMFVDLSHNFLPTNPQYSQARVESLAEEDKQLFPLIQVYTDRQLYADQADSLGISYFTKDQIRGMGSPMEIDISDSSQFTEPPRVEVFDVDPEYGRELHGSAYVDGLDLPLSYSDNTLLKWAYFSFNRNSSRGWNPHRSSSSAAMDGDPTNLMSVALAASKNEDIFYRIFSQAAKEDSYDKCEEYSALVKREFIKQLRDDEDLRECLRNSWLRYFSEQVGEDIPEDRRTLYFTYDGELHREALENDEFCILIHRSTNHAGLLELVEPRMRMYTTRKKASARESASSARGEKRITLVDAPIHLDRVRKSFLNSMMEYEGQMRVTVLEDGRRELRITFPSQQAYSEIHNPSAGDIASSISEIAENTIAYLPKSRDKDKPIFDVSLVASTPVGETTFFMSGNRSGNSLDISYKKTVEEIDDEVALKGGSVEVVVVPAETYDNQSPDYLELLESLQHTLERYPAGAGRIDGDLVRMDQLSPAMYEQAMRAQRLEQILREQGVELEHTEGDPRGIRLDPSAEAIERKRQEALQAGKRYTANGAELNSLFDTPRVGNTQRHYRRVGAESPEVEIEGVSMGDFRIRAGKRVRVPKRHLISGPGQDTAGRSAANMESISAEAMDENYELARLEFDMEFSGQQYFGLPTPFALRPVGYHHPDLPELEISFEKMEGMNFWQAAPNMDVPPGLEIYYDYNEEVDTQPPTSTEKRKMTQLEYLRQDWRRLLVAAMDLQPKQRVDAIFLAFNHNFTYNNDVAVDSQYRDDDYQKEIANAINGGKGNCGYAARNLVALYRQSGIPARLVSGYLPNQGSLSYSISNRHATVQVYLDGRWIDQEPQTNWMTTDWFNPEYVPELEQLPDEIVKLALSLPEKDYDIEDTAVAAGEVTSRGFRIISANDISEFIREKRTELSMDFSSDIAGAYRSGNPRRVSAQRVIEDVLTPEARELLRQYQYELSEDLIATVANSFSAFSSEREFSNDLTTRLVAEGVNRDHASEITESLIEATKRKGWQYAPARLRRYINQAAVSAASIAVVGILTYLLASGVLYNVDRVRPPADEDVPGEVVSETQPEVTAVPTVVAETFDRQQDESTDNSKLDDDVETGFPPSPQADLTEAAGGEVMDPSTSFQEGEDGDLPTTEEILELVVAGLLGGAVGGAGGYAIGRSNDDD